MKGKIYDPKYRGVPVLAFNAEKADFYPSRKAASESIAKVRGCSPHTADGVIRESIRLGEPRYGFYWKYEK